MVTATLSDSSPSVYNDLWFETANVLSRQRCGLEFDRAFLQDMFQELKIYDTDIDTHVYGAEDGSLYRNASELVENLDRVV